MIRNALSLVRTLLRLDDRLDRLQRAVGRIEHQLARQRGGAFEDHEWGVFSQWGEDGLIHHLVDRLEIPHRVFVEFGVEDYREANTRFLLCGGGWSGLVMDGSAEHVATIRRDEVAWRFPLQVKQAFVTAENIDELVGTAGIRGDIGLLSIDIDGNDYWVWKAIAGISPRIVVSEYNSAFGPTRAVTVPYRADFTRASAHHSQVYYGASISALEKLATEKGYVLVGGNRAGNNVFFVRRDVADGLPARTPAEVWRPASFREARDAHGKLTFEAGPDALRRAGTLPLVDVTNGRTVTIKDVLG